MTAADDARASTLVPALEAEIAGLRERLAISERDHAETHGRHVGAAIPRSEVRRVAVYALNRRQFWAHQPGETAVARAVAYQHIAGELIRLLDQEETDA